MDRTSDICVLLTWQHTGMAEVAGWPLVHFLTLCEAEIHLVFEYHMTLSHVSLWSPIYHVLFVALLRADIKT